MIFDPKNPKPGIYDGVPMEEYHRSSSISRSALKILDEEAPGELAHYLARGSGDATAAMTFGTAVGMLLFEPHLFERNFIERPAFSGANAPDAFRGAGSKERVAEWKEAHRDYQWLDPFEWAQAHEVVQAVRGSRAASLLLKSPELRVEQSIVWEDKSTGIMCRARPDAWRPDVGMTIDLKVTSDDLTDRALGNYVSAYYAHLQGAMCAAGLLANGQTFTSHSLIVVRRKAPIRVRVVTMRLEEPDQVPTWLEVGETMFEALLAEYAACRASGKFPNYGDQGSRLPVPAYVGSKIGSYTERARKASPVKEEVA